MNLNCQGFQPHGVRPSRCKRCFKEYREHSIKLNSSNLIANCDQNVPDRLNESSSGSSRSLQSTEPKLSLKEGVQNVCRYIDSASDSDNDNDDEDNSSNNEVYTSFKISVNSNTRDTKSPNRIKIISAQEEQKIDQDNVEFVLKVKPDQETHDLIATNKLQISSIDSVLNKINKKLEDFQKCSYNNLNVINSIDQLNQFKIDLNLSKFRLEEINDKLRRLQSNSNQKLDGLIGDKVNGLQSKLKEVQVTLANFQENITSLEKEIKHNQVKSSQLVERIKKMEDYNIKLNQLFVNKIKLLVTSPIKLENNNQIDLAAYNNVLGLFETRFKELNEQVKINVDKLNKKHEEMIKLTSKVEEEKVTNNRLKEELKKCQDRLKKNESVSSTELNKLEVVNNNQQSGERLKIATESGQDMAKLNEQLAKSEKMCSQLSQENEEYLKKIKLLEQELEELYDSFREDQVSEFRDIKKELEMASKNVRVLQFKLKKSERYCSQIENEKLNLENKMKELIETSLVSYDKQKMKDIQNELAIAKEVSLKLHSEIESMKEAKFKSDQSSSNQMINSHQNRYHLSVSTLASSSSVDTKDYQELVRSLYDTMEREKDLQEQLRFSEEESRVVRKKLSSVEQENEILMIQIKKMASKKGRSNKVIGTGGEESEEMSIDELRLHLELYEQEITVLRKKIDEIEGENENLQQEVKYLQDKLVSQPLMKIEIPEIPSGSPPNVIYEHKIRLLESEARDLRKKLVEREKGNENLRTELDIHRRKASKFVVRSRSFESEASADLKRQLHMMEQEAAILRHKVIGLEKENEKLLNDNKKIKLKTGRRSSLESVDTSKVFLRANLMNDPLENCESDLIDSMKRQISIKEEDELRLKRRITELEIDLSKINLDYKKLKDSFNYKKKPFRLVKESTTKLELKEIIKELEDEVTVASSNLAATKVINEKLDEEITQVKQELEMIQIESRNKKTKLLTQLESYKQEIESLEKKVNIYQNQDSSDSNLVNKVITSQDESQRLAKQLEKTKQEKDKAESEAKNLMCHLSMANQLKDELEAKNEASQKEKQRLNTELIEMRNKVKSFEGQLKDAHKDIDVKAAQIESITNECHQLKKKLKDETEKYRPPLSSNDVRINKDDYKKMKELEAKNESLEFEIKKLLREGKNLEDKLKESIRNLDMIVNEKFKIDSQNSLLQIEVTSIQNRLVQANRELDKVKSDLKESNEKCRLQSICMRKEKDEWQMKLSDQETQIRIEHRKREKLERDSDLALKGKEETIIQLKEKILQLEREVKRIKMIEEQEQVDHEVEMKRYEREASKAKSELSDLNEKYLRLESEITKLKTNQGKEKERLFKDLTTLSANYDDKVKELKMFKNSFGNLQEEWRQEKLDLQQDLQEMELKLKRMERISNCSSDNQKLGKESEDEQKIIKELKSENQKLKDKINSFNYYQTKSNYSDKGKVGGLNESEISFQTELTNLKANYEERLKILCNEIDLLIEERDQLELKLRLEGGKLGSIEMPKNENMDDIKLEIQGLRENLEAALAENVKLKAEYDCDKNSWLLQTTELKSKINETNERNSNQFSKSRLEVAWQKEREDLKKLVHESQKLIEEFKNKLVSAEQSKEKKKSDNKKKLGKLKKSMKQKQEYDQKRIGELNLNVISLRESCSKLIAENEELKKENFNLEKDKEGWKMRLFASISVENKLLDLREELDKLEKSIYTLEEKPQVKTNQNESSEHRKFLDSVKSKVEQLQKILKPKEFISHRRSFSFRNAISSIEMNSRPSNLDILGRMPPLGFKRLADSKSSLSSSSKTKSKKWLSLDQNKLMTNNSREHLLDSEDESVNTTLGSSISNLRYSQTLNYKHSISGYESEGSYGIDQWERKRDSSLDDRSDASAPAGPTSKSKRSLFNLLKKTRSVDNTCSSFDEDKSKSLKSNKDKGLRTRITNALKKTLTPSNLSLEKKPKEKSPVLKRTSEIRPLSVSLDDKSLFQTSNQDDNKQFETGKDDKFMHKSRKSDVSIRSRSTRV